MSDISEKFNVARSDVSIPSEDHAAYIRFHDGIDLEKHGETEVLHASKRLFEADVPLEEKREILFRLAHIGSIESFDTLCAYLKKYDSALHTWAILCLEECRTFLEMDIMDEEEGGMIMGPSGGIGQRIRHYVVIGATSDKRWDQGEHKAVKSAFLRSCDEWNSQIEEFFFGDDHLKITALIHIDTTVDDLIMTGIRLANEKEPLLKIHYYATSVEEPNEETIRWYLTEHAK